MPYRKQAEEFLKIAHDFSLGHLLTEQPHPLTQHLSSLAIDHLEEAYKVLASVDHDAYQVLLENSHNIFQMHQTAMQVLNKGNKVFLSGCGATGRLSLVIETLSRQLNLFPNQIIGFMAGGDYALIKSVESFEDNESYGERQIKDLGFQDKDLLLAITEGGETPFVIATCQYAARVSKIKPYFLYCNPDDSLKTIIRSAKILNHSQIEKINLTVGPMALTGSTRMQASTIQMMAAGLALLYTWKSEHDLKKYLEETIKNFKLISYGQLANLTHIEAQTIKNQGVANYITTADLSISVLTDTTERSPTFSQTAFENEHHANDELSLSYLIIKDAISANSAWEKLLGRKPRALSWQDLPKKIDDEEMIGFNLSLNHLKKRESTKNCINIEISIQNKNLMFEFQNKKIEIPIKDDHPLMIHTMLKVLLNAHSTLLMGRLGFYTNNIMTWVRPSNNKLIDRAMRFVQFLGKQNGFYFKDEQVIEEIFKEIHLGSKGAVVLHVYDRLTKL